MLREALPAAAVETCALSHKLIPALNKYKVVCGTVTVLVLPFKAASVGNRTGQDKVRLIDAPRRRVNFISYTGFKQRVRAARNWWRSKLLYGACRGPEKAADAGSNDIT